MSKAKNKNDLWTKIHDLINDRDIVGALELLSTYERQAKLNPHRRALLSGIYERINSFGDAIRILGPEMGAEDMERASEDELYVQMRLAYLLNQLGAKYVGERIYHNIDETIEKRGIDPLKINPFYYVQKFYSYRINYLFLKILNEIDLYISKTPTEDTRCRFHLDLYKSFALHGLGHSNEALKMNREYVENKQTLPYIRALALRAESAILVDLENYNEALKTIEYCEKEFKNDPYSREKMLYIFSKADIYLSLKKYDEAKELISEMIQIVDKGIKLPNDFLATLYLLSRLPDFEILLPYKISLRTLKNAFSYFAYGLGKVFKGSEESMLKLPSYFKNYNTCSDFDCWIAINNQIFATSYCSLDYRFLQSLNREIYDAYAGIIQLGKEQHVLSELQNNLLATLIGSGGVGINQWSLYDNTYRYVQMSEVGLERVKDLVKGMRRIGIEIDRNQNFYFYKFKPSSITILPMHDLRSQGLFHYLKHFTEEFDRKQLEEFFKIKKTAAINWINEWLEQNHIYSIGKGKNLKYRFKS